MLSQYVNKYYYHYLIIQVFFLLLVCNKTDVEDLQTIENNVLRLSLGIRLNDRISLVNILVYIVMQISQA